MFEREVELLVGNINNTCHQDVSFARARNCLTLKHDSFPKSYLLLSIILCLVAFHYAHIIHAIPRSISGKPFMDLKAIF